MPEIIYRMSSKGYRFLLKGSKELKFEGLESHEEVLKYLNVMYGIRGKIVSIAITE